MTFKLGTRGSRLALKQAQEVQAALAQKGICTELIVVRTRGDEQAALPLAQLGRGAFTDVFQEMLLAGELDLAVHSAKDLPVGEGWDNFFSLPRADARDVLVTAGRAVTRVATSSPRRALAAKKLFPAAEILPMRGNVDTRIRKLLAGETDALLLAAAGLQRLGEVFAGVEISPLPVEVCVPAPCQGILAIQGEAGRCIHDEGAGRAALIERKLQRALDGDCAGGVGCYFDGRTLLASKNGRTAQLDYAGEESILQLAEVLR